MSVYYRTLTISQTNVLIDDGRHARLVDFGLIAISDGAVPTSTNSSMGSARWTAPELIIPREFGIDIPHQTYETDVYAFACLCLEVLLTLYWAL
jgi:serine/threonine protein kinase